MVRFKKPNLFKSLAISSCYDAKESEVMTELTKESQKKNIKERSQVPKTSSSVERTSKVKVNVRGFKVSSCHDRSVRKGVAVTSLNQLREEARMKLGMEERSKSQFKVFLTDGTEVEDEEYFSSLKSQTLLILSDEPNFRTPKDQDVSHLENFLKTIRWSSDAKIAFEGIRRLFEGDQSDNWKTIMEHLTKRERTSNLSLKSEDPEWFNDISTNAKSKEEYLTKSCQARIRGYLAKAEKQVKDSKLSRQQRLLAQDIIDHFKSTLKQNSHHGFYFDRRAAREKRICDEQGLFSCEGRFNQDSCLYARGNTGKGDEIDDVLKSVHQINPYESAESRIVFSTWNLDHVIERSRSVVPSLLLAIQNIGRSQVINKDYFYSLLFTRQNLKLVHIVCHDKQEHLAKKCDEKLFYVYNRRNK